jgi:hypothetical protein
MEAASLVDAVEVVDVIVLDMSPMFLNVQQLIIIPQHAMNTPL